MQKLRLVNHSECFVQPLKVNYAILLTFARQLSHYQTRATEILAIEINNVYLKLFGLRSRFLKFLLKKKKKEPQKKSAKNAV